MSKRNQKCGQLIYKCENCNHEVELHLNAKPTKMKADKTKEKVRNIENYSNMVDEEKINLPVCITLTYDGFWVTNDGKHVWVNDESCDRNSVMLNNNCLLYVYKLALRHLLLSRQIISPYDIDAQNLVPHVVVRKNKHDTNSKYVSAKNEQFIITEEMITVKNDFLLVELDEKRDLHMTLIYNKKIKRKIDLLGAFKEVIENLNNYPQLIDDYANLDNFGAGEIDYWYENAASYPLHVKKPIYYVTNQITKTIPQHVSAAGSILSNI